MKAAVLIQVHKNPEQVARLCQALRHPAFDLYLNVDAKSDMEPFRRLIPDVRYVAARTAVYWGDYSQVETTLRGLREIMAVPIIYDYVLFISGQDYPVIPPASMVARLGADRGTEYIPWIGLEGDDAYRRAMRRRYEHYHFRLRNRTLGAILDRLFRTVWPVRRRVPLPAMYKGSSWWMLTGDCVRYVLDFCEERPDVLRFFEHVKCADELFFQSVILNSLFAGRVLSENYRYTDWSAGQPNPKLLDTTDFERIVSSGKWFARKLDLNVSPQLFDRLDESRTRMARLETAEEAAGETLP